jgi:signal transduction histidine kinase
MATVDVEQATRLVPLIEIARAATGAVDRTAFLPLVAREAARVFEADTCEIWLEDGGLPTVSAVHRSNGGEAESPSEDDVASALGGTTVQSGTWLCTPVPGESGPRGVLAISAERTWTEQDRSLVDLVATVIALGLRVAEAGPFDDQARDEFLALVGHDLRSPLSNVRVGAQLARKNLDAGDLESVSQALTIIENQSARLLERLEALLDAVAASGRWLIRLEPLDLPAMAEISAEAYRLAAAEAGASTTIEVAAEPGTPLARGDAAQIAQVLDHLLDNAAKFAEGGHITVTASAAGAMVRVDVCDDGPGIRPEDVHRVFAPFGRGRSEASRDGHGLGLYLARNIIAAHGGKLWIARTSRSGTCMAFTLPTASPDNA